MSFDINLYRAAKAARLAAGEKKYSDTSPTEPNPAEDLRVKAECDAGFYTPEAPELVAVTIDVPEMAPAAPVEAPVEPADKPATE